MSEHEMKGDLAYRKVVTRAWSDPKFKAQLLADPHTALAEQGVVIPPGVTVKVVENTEKVVHMILPPPLDKEELSETELDQVAGGLSFALMLPGFHFLDCQTCRGSTQGKGCT